MFVGLGRSAHHLGWRRNRQSASARPTKAMLVHCPNGTTQLAKGPFRDRVKIRAVFPEERGPHGFGSMDTAWLIPAVTECTSNRATLFGYGSLSAKDVYEYRIPMPPQHCRAAHLPSGHRDVGLADPINPEHRHHRVAKLRFQMRKPDGSRSRRAGNDKMSNTTKPAMGRSSTRSSPGISLPTTSGLCFTSSAVRDAGTLSDPIPLGGRSKHRPEPNL